MINLGLTVTFATLKYPLTQFPLSEEGGGGGGREKGNNTCPLFRKNTDNANRIPWKRGYSLTDKKSISLPFLGTGQAHSQRSLQFVIPIFLTLCRTLAVAWKGFGGMLEYRGVASVFSNVLITQWLVSIMRGELNEVATTLFRIS